MSVVNNVILGVFSMKNHVYSILEKPCYISNIRNSTEWYGVIQRKERDWKRAYVT